MARSSVAIDRRASTGRKQARHHPKLVLASEALKEDIAPIEPGRGAGRLGIGGVALALVLLGLQVEMKVAVAVISIPHFIDTALRYCSASTSIGACCGASA